MRLARVHRISEVSYHARKVRKQNNNTAEVTQERDLIRISSIDRIEFSKGLIASTDNVIVSPGSDESITKQVNPAYSGRRMTFQPLQVSKCDTIILKTGSVIFAKVEEISQTEVKYRRCDNLSGPLHSIIKSDVSSIRYVNGTRDNFTPVVDVTYTPAFSPQNSLPQQTQGLAVAGFISSVVGLFIASIPLGLLAIIFGGISLKKIRGSQGRLRGRGLAIAGIVIGIIDVVVMIIVLAAI